MDIIRIHKPVGEDIPITLDYAGQLPSGTSVSSASATATKRSNDSVDTSIFNETTLAVTNTTVLVRFKDGTDGEAYRAVITVTLDDSFTILKDFIELYVRDPA